MRWLVPFLLLLGCPEPVPGFARGDDDDAAGEDDDDAAPEDLPDACEEAGAVRVRLADQAFDAWCEDGLHGGGWMLLLVSADDGQDTWTWAARSLWDAVGASVGGVQPGPADLRSPALGLKPIGELLFVHRPSDVTALYALPATAPLPEQLPAEADCSPQPLPLVAGSLGAGLCDTDLYLSPADLDGVDCDVPEPHRSDAWGPAWSVGGNDGCPLDDVGETGSLGPSALEDPAVEYGLAEPAVGFGRALGLNTGVPGSGQNRIEVYGR